MDRATIVLIILAIVFAAIMIYAVITRGRQRSREWTRPGTATLPAPGEKSAGSAAYKFSEGKRLLQIGDYQAAVQAFSAAITIDPDHWSAYFRRSEAYRNLGMEEQGNADLARAEFLKRLVRREALESGTAFDGAVAGVSGGSSVGAIFGGIVGAIVGAIAGFVVGCVMGLVYLCFVTGPAGAILGGIAGYRASRGGHRLGRWVL